MLAMGWIKSVANYQVRAMRGDYLPRIPLPLLPFFLRLGRELETRAPEETVAILAGHNFDSLQEEGEREREKEQQLEKKEEKQGGGGAVANFRSRPQATRCPPRLRHRVVNR